MEHLPNAPFLLWNPQSGEKLWHLSEADSSFLSQNSSEGKLTWPSLKAAQGRAANSELLYTTVYKKDSNERGKQSLAGADPWDAVPAGRNLILAGTTIHSCPKGGRCTHGRAGRQER